MRTLVLSGILDEEHHMRLRIPFPAELPGPVGAEPTSADVMEASLHDREGHVLSRGLLDMRSLCVMPGDGATTVEAIHSVDGAIPYPDGVATLRLRWHGRTVHEAHATEGRPQISLTWAPQPGAMVSGPQVITWTASHPDSAPLAFTVALRGPDRSVQTVAESSASGAMVDFGSLSQPGPVSVVVAASDGFHVESDETVPFSIGS
jgi:hypothetical protein